MKFGQPPSWRPDVEQFRAEVYRGTVRDALGGLRNLEQLLGSLRVGPRALSSILPDVRSSCPALSEAIDGLATLVVAKLPDAEGIALALRQLARGRLDSLATEISALEQQSLNAKNRLRLEEAVSNVTRDVESIVDLVDLLGEVAWGRTMSLDISEVAREAYRSSEPAGSPQPANRLTLVSDNTSGEHVSSPRALTLILQHLVRWSVGCVPSMSPVVSVKLRENQQVEITIQDGSSSTGEARWAPGRRLLPLSEEVLRIAARAMQLNLELRRDTGQVQLLFASTTATVQ
jgi:hypothetical protein